MTDYSRNTLMEFINSKPQDIEICDVTLRDGEQTPGVVFTREEKIAIAEKLDSIGIEVIEAGFPVVSHGEEAIVRDIAHLGLMQGYAVLPAQWLRTWTWRFAAMWIL